MEQRLQSYLDGEIVRLRTGVHSYEVRTSHGTGKGSTVAEALKDLANQQVEESKAESTSLNIQAEDVKPKKKRKSKKKVEPVEDTEPTEAES